MCRSLPSQEYSFVGAGLQKYNRVRIPVLPGADFRSLFMTFVVVRYLLAWVTCKSNGHLDEMYAFRIAETADLAMTS